MDERILEARKPLVLGDISHVKERYHRVLSFDPTEVYNSLGSLINPYKRGQNLYMDNIFPEISGECACGCGKKLEGRRRKWASDKCKIFPLQLYWILKGDTGVIGAILDALYGWKCCKCNRGSHEIDRPGKWDMRTPIEIEHLLPVKHGGGGSWLSNYRLMCFECHREKTNEDFGWKKKIEKKQIKLF